jgi:hypothetical protein
LRKALAQSRRCKGDAMLVGLSEAARLTGKNQSTIHRAMRAGRLAYSAGAAGERTIDTAELDRVFPITTNGVDARAQPVQSNVAHEPEGERIIAAQRATIERLDATIRDLRARLDAEGEERRRLVAVITDQRPRPPWWRRWFRAG